MSRKGELSARDSNENSAKGRKSVGAVLESIARLPPRSGIRQGAQILLPQFFGSQCVSISAKPKRVLIRYTGSKSVFL